MSKSLKYLKEDDFREAIVIPWLRKKGYRILRQHGHGFDEQGKDIVIEKLGKIGACVVKPKIHGQYSKEGNVEEIRNQISAALSVPFPDYINKDRRKIDFVIVISENKITSSAKESIIESFKENKEVVFYSGVDILEEYYALPLKLKNISINIYFCPKNVEGMQELNKEHASFKFEVENTGDCNNFAIFNRTHNCGEIREVIMSKILDDPLDLTSLDINTLYNSIKNVAKKEPLITIFIYFEEDNIDKIENFFDNYIENCFNSPTLDKQNGKIAVYFESDDLDKFNKLILLVKKWS